MFPSYETSLFLSTLKIHVSVMKLLTTNWKLKKTIWSFSKCFNCYCYYALWFFFRYFFQNILWDYLGSPFSDPSRSSFCKFEWSFFFFLISKGTARRFIPSAVLCGIVQELLLAEFLLDILRFSCVILLTVHSRIFSEFLQKVLVRFLQ